MPYHDDQIAVHIASFSGVWRRLVALRTARALSVANGSSADAWDATLGDQVKFLEREVAKLVERISVHLAAADAAILEVEAGRLVKLYSGMVQAGAVAADQLPTWERWPAVEA